jgi:hypothetical protein
MDATQRVLSDQLDDATQRLLSTALELAEPMASQRRDRLARPRG